MAGKQKQQGTIDLSSDDSVNQEGPTPSKSLSVKRKIEQIRTKGDEKLHSKKRLKEDHLTIASGRPTAKEIRIKDTNSSNSCTPVCESNPLNFFYIKVMEGLDSKFNPDHNTLSIRQILSKRFGLLKQSVQFNYLIDVEWLIDKYDPDFRQLPLTIVAQNKPDTVKQLNQDAKSYPNVKLAFANLNGLFDSKLISSDVNKCFFFYILDAWGTHHTKMMILQYETGIRVIIHTSNLINEDWHQKTQALYVSDLLPPLDVHANSDDFSKTQFKKDFIEYLQAYKLYALNVWIALIKRHDFSSVNVFLVGSVPGRHIGQNLNRFGHMKLRKILSQNCSESISSDWQVIGQFSSIGSLGKDASVWMTGEFLHSLSSHKSSTPKKAFLNKSPLFKLVFPSVENVRTSLEGYKAGGSIPYNQATAKKQEYLVSFMSQWRSECLGRSRASPHIKTYIRCSKDCKKIAWLVLTSANLSKAAWGNLEKNKSQLAIRSFELGVVFIPQMIVRFF